MKATIESTSAVVEVKGVKCRVWECISERGVKFVAYIPLVQVHKSEDNTQFESELVEHKLPEAFTQRAIDARFIL